MKRESELVEIDNNRSDPPTMTLEGDNENKKKIYLDKPIIAKNNAILDELNSFAISIKNDTDPKVSIFDGHNALDVAIKIINNFK